MTNSPDFHTSDLNLAAFLVARGVPLLALDGPPGRRVFHFPPESSSHAPAFYQNAPAPARALTNAIRDLKAMVRQQS